MLKVKLPLASGHFCDLQVVMGISPSLKFPILHLLYFIIPLPSKHQENNGDFLYKKILYFAKGFDFCVLAPGLNEFMLTTIFIKALNVSCTQHNNICMKKKMSRIIVASGTVLLIQYIRFKDILLV